MNLIDAIKSGRPFRRKACPVMGDAWVTLDRSGDPNDSVQLTSDDTDYDLSTADLLADDWEIKPEAREWWVVVSSNPGPLAACQNVQGLYDHREDAEKGAIWSSGTVVHVREVVE